jgi:hypothetical protein
MPALPASAATAGRKKIPDEVDMRGEAERTSSGSCRGRDSNPHAPQWGQPILSRPRITNFATPARQG